MDVRAFNRTAWDKEVERGNRWSVPVSSETIAAAKRGEWEVILTPQKPVPRSWFGELAGRDVLCLASGGGQQAPVLAAAGATVTLLDNSPKQLAQDKFVADRDGLAVEIVEGDMANMPMFPEERFDLIFHPCSNCFVSDVRPVWREAFRVLRRGGLLLSGLCNPALFIFDEKLEEKGELKVRHSLPYSDLKSMTKEELEAKMAKGDPLYFSHTLDDLIGGQIDAGFYLTGFFEDYFPGTELAKFMPAYIATKALKPA